MSGLRSILAVELCLAYDPAVHGQLFQLFRTPIAHLGYGPKWQLFNAAARTLGQAAHLWRKGCWDFWDDDARARSDFNMWVQGMLTREGARTEPSGQPDVYRGDQRFLTLTLAAMMAQGTASERTVASLCAVPESQLWMRDSFMRVLGAVAHINFASVEASTLYLIPRDAGWALTSDDLRHPKFEYLRDIV